MIPLRKALQSMEKGLEGLMKKTKDMQEMLDNLEQALTLEKPRRKAKAKPGRKRAAKKRVTRKKPAKETATNAVVNTITKSKKGATTEQIKTKTGFDEKKIWGIITRAKKEGKIKSQKRGIYVKA